MKTIENTLYEEMKQLEKLVEEAKNRLRAAPKGHLRIVKKRDGVEYYYKGEGVKSNGRYMKKDEKQFARRIAQRDYDVSVIKNAVERIKAIEKFLKIYEKTCLKQLYKKTNLYRRELITAKIISDDEFIKQWQSVEYKGKQFSDDEKVIITDRGERVRSKSEKIIADKLYSLGIPYRYEYPLVLEGNIKIYPDFTVLRMPAREELYLEHFGMLDDTNYVENVIFKLSTYERNGIYIGDKLFITYETSKKPINTIALDKMLKKIILVE